MQSICQFVRGVASLPTFVHPSHCSTYFLAYIARPFLEVDGSEDVDRQDIDENENIEIETEESMATAKSRRTIKYSWRGQSIAGRPTTN